MYMKPATPEEWLVYVDRLRTMKDTVIKNNWKTIAKLMKKIEQLENELKEKNK